MRWREDWSAREGAGEPDTSDWIIVLLCDEVERLRAENEILRAADYSALVSPPPRTEEEPAHDFYARGVHRQCRKCDLILTASEDAAKYPCEPAPAPSQPQKATHPYGACDMDEGEHCGLRDSCHFKGHFAGVLRLCRLPASDPIHAPAAHTEQP